MTPKQYTRLLKRYIAERFDTQKEAAEAFGCSATTMCLVLMGERSPNFAMLEATGYRYRETRVRQYLRVEDGDA